MKISPVVRLCRTHVCQRGFTLIELMISLTIGMMIVITIGYIYLGASRTFRALEASSRMQENARYAIEKIGYDIRMAGFTGCSHNSVANVLNSPTSWEYNLFDKPLVGYEEGVSLFPTGVTGNVLRGDALTILRADKSKEYIVDSHDPDSAQFQLTANHNLKQGEILVVTDCSHAAVFQMTNVNNNNTIKNIVHNSGAGVLPGNATKNLGHPPYPPCTADCGFPAGSRILRLSAVTYYIRTGADGNPGLYRHALGRDANTGNSVTTPVELVKGVEDMQIEYGVDTDAIADGAVDAYLDANEVDALALGDKWSRVLSVRLSLLMASLNSENVASSQQTYTYSNGTTVTDNKMRKVFTTTIAVRNRL
jgi:type IV pilus assembly protein PilW